VADSGPDATRVLKVAVDDAATARIADEAGVLAGLNDPRLVRLVEGPLDVGGRQPWCWRAPATRPWARCCAAAGGCPSTCWSGGAPRFGDGLSDPASVRDEATIAPDMFDAAVAEPLAGFFRTALARSAKERHDTAAEIRQWRDRFGSTVTGRGAGRENTQDQTGQADPTRYRRLSCSWRTRGRRAPRPGGQWPG
jgi:hypothetical protein